MRAFRFSRAGPVVVLAVVLAVLAPAKSAKEASAMQTENERFIRGWAALAALDEPAARRVQESLQDVAPDMGRFVIEFAYGDVFSRPGLDPLSRQAATIAALAALGTAEPQLRFHIGAGLSAGLAPEQVVEILYVTTVFAGFPAGLNGLAAAREVFAARNVRPAQSPPADAPRRERGLAALEATSRGAGQQVLDSLADIAPDMAGFILDFSYGDVISRPVLSPRLKEIAMIAAAIARGTMAPQLKVHIRAGLNVGLARQEIVETLMQMAVYAGFPAALNGLAAAREVFAAEGAPAG